MKRILSLRRENNVDIANARTEWRHIFTMFGGLTLKLKQFNEWFKKTVLLWWPKLMCMWYLDKSIVFGLLAI